MRLYSGLILNATFLCLCYISRCLVMNLNMIFNIVYIVEGSIVIVLLFRLLVIPTKVNVKKTTIHIAVIAAFFLIVGHLISIVTLQLYHFRAIKVFEKYQTMVPDEDRVNGDWILDVPEFTITRQERAILEANYKKSSPCLYQYGYCFFELGGFLHNTGGYCLRLSTGKEHPPGSFGFHRIDKIVELIGDWSYYE